MSNPFMKSKRCLLLRGNSCVSPIINILSYLINGRPHNSPSVYFLINIRQQRLCTCVIIIEKKNATRTHMLSLTGSTIYNNVKKN